MAKSVPKAVRKYGCTVPRTLVPMVDFRSIALRKILNKAYLVVTFAFLLRELALPTLP